MMIKIQPEVLLHP